MTEKMFRKFIFLFGTCSIILKSQGSTSVEAVTNIAFGKPVILSSQYNELSAGSKAVDGVKTGLWKDGCASTNFESNPSMILDLENVHSISSVVLYNRVNCCPGRLREVHIEVSTDGQTYDEIVDHPAAIGASKAFDFTPPLPSGRYLKIRLDANEYLTLCEVEVFGDGVITQVEREEPAFSLDVDGGWSDYGDWTQCMRSCGPGTQTRSRTCTNPPPSGEGAPCDGDATETRMCNTVDCPSDCQDYLAMGNTASGIYTIYPSKSFYGFEVYCDMETDGGGWTVFQRREDGSVDFFLNWLDYQYGFGDPNGEHWLGNEKIRNIVKQSSYELRIDLEDFDGNTRYARYKYFEIGTAAEKFKLRAEDYTGDAGDSLSYHSGQPFSTKDKDSTAHACSTAYKGAWWYRSCHQSNLNGLYLNGPHSTYADGIEWYHWKEYYYSLKKTEMKTRRH